MAAELGAGLRIFRDVSRRQPCRDTPASFASIWGWGCACLLLFSFPPFYLFIYFCRAVISSPGWKGMKRGKAVGLSLFSFPFPFAFSLFLFPLSFLLCWRASLLPTACLYQESRLAIRGGSERHWVKKKKPSFFKLHCLAFYFIFFWAFHYRVSHLAEVWSFSQCVLLEPDGFGVLSSTGTPAL